MNSSSKSSLELPLEAFVCSAWLVFRSACRYWPPSQRFEPWPSFSNWPPSLKTFQTFVRSLSDVLLRPFVPTMAVSLKFRTHQLCRKIWIGIAFLLDPPQDEEIVDPTVYVYDPRGRSFQSFDPNWKPCLGAFRRKMAKQRHVGRIRPEVQGRAKRLSKGNHPSSELSACTTHKILPATGCNSPPRQSTTLTQSKGASFSKRESSSPPPGILATAVDSDTDASSHGDTSLLELVD